MVAPQQEVTVMVFTGTYETYGNLDEAMKRITYLADVVNIEANYVQVITYDGEVLVQGTQRSIVNMSEGVIE